MGGLPEFATKPIATSGVRHTMHTWVDVAIYSAEVKLVKPDARIYQLALSQLGVGADECVFVDDAPANVQAARALGMQASLHQDARQTINDIQGYLD
jgi:putative hydrolase of the HAD superfamily